MDKVCGVCFRKETKGNQLRKITGKTLEYIQKYHWSAYNVASGDYARKVCTSCYNAAHDVGKAGGPEGAKRKLPAPKYDSIEGNKITRSSPQWAIPQYLDHLHHEILFFWQKSLRTIYTYHLVPLKLPKNVQGGPFQGLLVFYHFFPKIYNFTK